MNKVLLIVGILGFLLFGLVLVICLLLPALTNGRSSFEETVWADIGSCFCSLVFLIMAVVGLVLVMKAKKKAQQTPGA